uniref:Uncharacterized protein n=1 Tax=Sphaerodactylus townsendi TaxID=933632 RepID=A0ACB8FI80_9SAUR
MQSSFPNRDISLHQPVIILLHGICFNLPLIMTCFKALLSVYILYSWSHCTGVFDVNVVRESAATLGVTEFTVDTMFENPAQFLHLQPGSKNSKLSTFVESHSKVTGRC